MTDVSTPAPARAPHHNGSLPGGADSPSERDGRRGPRPLRRRRGLPNSRAIVGGLLVAAAAVGMFAAYLRVNSGPGETFVVARNPVSAGSRLQASDLALAPMQLPVSLRGRAFDDPSAVVGATVLSPLGAGELVQASAVVAQEGAPPSRELSFPVERGHLTPSLREGERVDVLATFGSAADAVTTVVLRHALVIGLARDKTNLGDAGATVVTVALDRPDDALAMAHAVQLAKLTVVRATGAPPDAGSSPSYRLNPPGGAPDSRTTGP